MNKKIKILHLEDSLNDSELICALIKSGSIEHDYFLTDIEKDFINILETENIDIILSDYNLPGYRGNKALKLAREKYSQIPFIFVSGAMGENTAIDAMLNGATDYVFKNKLERLVPAIKRAIQENELKIKNEQAEINLKEKNELIEVQNKEYIKINKKLSLQNIEKGKRAAELIITHKELLFQHGEKEKRAAELAIANKELIKANKKFRLVVESAPNAMMLVDKNDIISLINNQTEILFGYEREELIGQKLEILVPDRFRNQLPANRTMYFKRKPRHSKITTSELFAMRKNGTEVQVEISLNPIETDEGHMELVSIVDLTERKIQEATLKKQMELEIKNQELEQFAYIASHDLQEPLRTVSNYMQVFEEDYLELLDEKARNYLHSVKNATKRMSQLIKSLLDFSRLGRNSKLTLVDCKKLINNVITDIETLIKTSNTIIEISEMPVLYVYETEMRIVFQNLITNAIKYQKKDTQPIIKIHSEKINNIWNFSVSDNGIGIALAHYKRVFDIFKRLQTNEKEYKGSGIGLANCKKIVQMHKGEIWIESNLGIGTTFHFTITDLKNEK